MYQIILLLMPVSIPIPKCTGDLIKLQEDVEQITKADRNACHALCGKANPAPRYGGLVPPFYVPLFYL